MNCLSCGRALTRFAASVPTKTGLQGWGPKCLARVQIVQARTAWGCKAELRQRAVAADARQMALEWTA